ncbi:MAG: ubiquitin [Oscillospiraceae bacterium]|nr:ubiquitin [Oscillospiraceae bacterium]
MMDRIELVEKLRERAGVTYEEAKAALEESKWDLLDAVVLLEKQGKVGGVGYSTKHDRTEESKDPGGEKAKKPKGDGFEKFITFLGKIIHKGNTNSLVVLRHSEEKFSLPVTAFVLLLAIGFWVVPFVMIGSLFCGFHYKFRGPDLGKDSINSAMDKAAKAAEAAKEHFHDNEDVQAAKEEIKEELEELKKEMEEAIEEAKKEIEELDK